MIAKRRGGSLPSVPRTALSRGTRVGFRPLQKEAGQLRPVFPCLVWGLIEVSRAEEQPTATRDVPFWDQIIELDQFFLLAWPLWNL